MILVSMKPCNGLLPHVIKSLPDPVWQPFYINSKETCLLHVIGAFQSLSCEREWDAPITCNEPGCKLSLWVQTFSVFYPRPVLTFGYCHCLCLCVCVPVCVCVRTITHHPFKLGSPNLYWRCKTTWLRSLLFCERLALTFKVKFNLRVKISLCPVLPQEKIHNHWLCMCPLE